MLAALCN